MFVFKISEEQNIFFIPKTFYNLLKPGFWNKKCSVQNSNTVHYFFPNFLCLFI